MKFLTSIGLLLLLLSACRQNGQEDTLIESESNASLTTSLVPSPVSIEEAEEPPLILQGIVEIPPNQQVSVQPFFEGKLTNIRVLEGSQVKKGDLLFSLTNPQFIEIQQDFLIYKAQMEYLEEALKRKESLNLDKITSDDTFQKTKMNYLIAKANLESTKKTLELMNIPAEFIRADNLKYSIPVFAPIAGSVEGVSKTNGTYVSKQDEILRILNTDHIHLEIKAFEKDLMVLYEGQLIRFSLPETGIQSHAARIILIGKAIDENTRMINIHAHPEDETLKLVPGMYVEVLIPR